MPSVRLITALALVFVAGACSDTPAPPPAAVPGGEVVDGGPGGEVAGGPASARESAVPLSPTTAPSPAAPSPAKTAPARTPSKTPDFARFVAGVQRDLPEVAVDRRDEEVAQMATEACTAGRKPAAAIAAIRDLGVSDTQARQLFHLAKGTACRS